MVETIVGVANLPNQLHRILTRKGANFTLLVVGESGLGKTTFINTLFTTTVLESEDMSKRHQSKPSAKTVQLEMTKAVIEEKGFHCRLTVIDTPGFGDYVNNSRCWLPIVQFLDDQHEAFFRHENQPNRKQFEDMRVHACMYFLPPTGQSLRSLDIQAMKELSKRVNLIPVVAKADTISPSTLGAFKERIREAIAEHGISPYTSPIESEDEETTKRNIDIMVSSWNGSTDRHQERYKKSSMPFAVIGSTKEATLPDGKKVLGRQYSWGIAEVENDAHCDFKKLRSLLIRTHMHDLISTTDEIHYESFRMNRLQNRGGYVDDVVVSKARHNFEALIKEEELRFRNRLAEKVKVEEQRFQQWEQRLVAERGRLTKNLEAEHSQLKQLIAEVEGLEMTPGGRRK